MKTLESRSRILQQGSRILAKSRFYHSYTPTLETRFFVGRHVPRGPKDIYPWCLNLIYQRRRFTTKNIKPIYLREISQYFWHFISSLSTTDIDNDVGVWKLGQRLRDDSLSTTKGTWDSCCATLYTSKIATTTKVRVLIYCQEQNHKPSKLPERNIHYYIQVKTCNLFFNIAAKQIEKLRCRFYHPRPNLSCMKTGRCKLGEY